jgi:hypothetical protein
MLPREVTGTTTSAAEGLLHQAQYSMHIINEYANKGLSVRCNEPCAEHNLATRTRIGWTLEEVTLGGIFFCPGTLQHYCYNAPLLIMSATDPT